MPTCAEVNNVLNWPNSTTGLSLLFKTNPCSSSWYTHLGPGDWSVPTFDRDILFKGSWENWPGSWLTRASPAKIGYTDVVWVQTGWLLACLKDNSPCENFHIDSVLGLHLIPKYISKNTRESGRIGRGKRVYAILCSSLLLCLDIYWGLWLQGNSVLHSSTILCVLWIKHEFG